MNEQLKDVALGLVLTEWNDEQTIEEIFSEGNDETTPWEPYEYFYLPALKKVWEGIYQNLEWAYEEGKKSA